MSEGEGVLNRRMIFCKTLLSKYTTDELYTTCSDCDQFLCICCRDYSNDTTCHHYPLVFTDGACSRNGLGDATSGIGGSFGEDVEYQWSMPVNHLVDSTPVHTNQRAELLAVIEGVRRLGDFLQSKWDPENRPSRDDRAEMVVATDSEYVCKGVTEWMPKWKTNGWRTSSGKIVSNKDLFCTLDEAISALERRHLDVGLWWIDRQFNGRADALAKAACSPGSMSM